MKGVFWHLAQKPYLYPIMHPIRKLALGAIPFFQISPIIHKAWRRNDSSKWPPKEFQGNTNIQNYEYSLFSQGGEDGIIRYLFSEIGYQSRVFLEFGFGTTENNCLRLMLKERFGGLYIDGSKMTVKQFNKAAKSSGVKNVKAIRKYLTKENIEATIMEGNLPRNVEILSIDVDGNDYWFWEVIECISPRIVVIEYNASLGPQLTVTIPYDPLFDRYKKHPCGFYHGASLRALERLGKRKGYRLVGCDSNGINAFFLREDSQSSKIKTQSAESAFMPHKGRLARGFNFNEQYEMIKNLPYIIVD